MLVSLRGGKIQKKSLLQVHKANKIHIHLYGFLG